MHMEHSLASTDRRKRATKVQDNEVRPYIQNNFNIWGKYNDIFRLVG